MQRTVLIVEDEFLIAMHLKRLLEEHGWRVMGPAATVQHALRLLDEELPDVALLDVNLGREMVTPVVEALRARSVPFALASAYDRPDQFAGGVLAGAVYVGKPATERRVLAVLGQLIDRELVG